jgi:hypothetical protein
MIFVGLDDTDMPDTRGTNKLARAMIAALAAEWKPHRLLRHQLLDDPRVPCTSKNGSASIALEPRNVGCTIPGLVAACRRMMLEDFIPGSDPGLCVTADEVSNAVRDFGRRCQRELVSRDDAFALARQEGIYLEGLGGTNGGVIGALAAVALASGGNDGRIVQWREYADDLSGPQPIAGIQARDIAVVELESQQAVEEGTVDVGKRLRPNYRHGQAVLFVQPRGDALGGWQAIKLT